MLKQISNWLHNISKNWVTLIAFVVFVGFMLIVLPQQAAKSESQTGASASPDTSLIYSADDLYQMAETYGEQGRKAYVQVRFTFDLIWPLVYTLFLVTSISWLTSRFLNSSSPLMRLNLVPLLAAILDYLENVFASLVMWRYPALTPVVDVLTPIFTFTKWIFVGGSFLLLVLGVGGWLWQLRKRTRG